MGGNPSFVAACGICSLRVLRTSYDEMDAIHYANSLFWKQGNDPTRAARAEYQERQERLEQIREQLAQLRQSVLI
jgi:hypothetical protein